MNPDEESLADRNPASAPRGELASLAIRPDSIAREPSCALSMPSTLLQTASDDAAFHILRAERALERGELERFYHHARMAGAAHVTVEGILEPLKNPPTQKTSSNEHL